MSFVRPLVLLFALGAIVVSFFDGFHTHSGTTMYPSTVVFDMAWWTPLLFGSVVSGGGLLYARGWRALRAPARVAPWSTLATAFAMFGGLYWASAYLPLSNAGKLAVLLVGAAIVWAVADRTWQGVVLACGGAIAGCATEHVLQRIDAFRHLHPDVLLVPMWLPALYLAAAPAIGQIARRVLAPSRFAEPSRRSS